jgi:hypothetical protein
MDISSILKSLNAQRVQYVVIGGMALPAHGYVRFTVDIDILIKPTRENARRTIAGLARVGYDVTDLSIDGMLAKKILFRQYVWLPTFIQKPVVLRSIRSGETGLSKKLRAFRYSFPVSTTSSR